MSYKVNGYKIENVTITELHKKIKNIQEKARVIGKDFFHKAVAKEACHIIDLHKVSLKMRPEYLPKEEKNEHPLASACKEIDKGVSNLKKGERSPLVSMELEVCIYPVTDNSFIMSVYTEREEYSDLFVKEGFVEYNYQNSTDKPDNVSKRQWDQRKKNWDNLVREGSPSENGFSVTIVKQLETFFLEDDCLMNNIPNKEERVKHVFGSISYDLKRIKEGKTKEEFEWKNFMDHIWWLQDMDEGKQFKKENLIKINEILSESYTLTDLLGFERKK